MPINAEPTPLKIPQQSNSVDCGVFVLEAMYWFIENCLLMSTDDLVEKLTANPPTLHCLGHLEPKPSVSREKWFSLLTNNDKGQA